MNVRLHVIYIRMGSYEDMVGYSAALLHFDVEETTMSLRPRSRRKEKLKMHTP